MLGNGFDYEFDFGTPAALPRPGAIHSVFAQLSAGLEVPAVLQHSPRSPEPFWEITDGAFRLVCDTTTASVNDLVGALAYLERLQRKIAH